MHLLGLPIMRCLLIMLLGWQGGKACAWQEPGCLPAFSCFSKHMQIK